ncbi:UNVERIFIED_CONTAM: hypothetical protein Sangu_2775300 [Sesamum angustifolium]|uniref:Tify domain-containing protein n=1 Tax=Sesamum angustifolium TaxID=2727405 RepID=A0AAW2IU11_9LAMI
MIWEVWRADLVVVERREAEKLVAELREDMPLGIESRMKMSTKVELRWIPTKLKDLLQTGLLEGLPVRYIHGSKRRRRPESELRGVIQGAGILCSCDECKERNIVTPNQFEMHAGSANKRPPKYIFLDNGKSLRDVLNACKANLSESLESVILNAIGRSNYTTASCINCKDDIHVSIGWSICSCSSSRPPVVSESAQISSQGHPQTKRQGKLTRKDLRMHKSVLAEDVLPEGTALSYVIHREVSPSQFEAHAGFASHRKPYMSIYTSNGVSLHHYRSSYPKAVNHLQTNTMISVQYVRMDEICYAVKTVHEAFTPLCFICRMHRSLSYSRGIWYCKYCQNMFEKEKFAEPDANALAAGRVPGVDPLQAITQRCIRVVGTLEPEIGGCAICRCHDFCKSRFTARTIILCDQECEKEYHVGCLKEQNIDHLKMKCEGQDLHKNPELGWRLLRGKKATEDSRVWLSGADNIFHDRFDPISDAVTAVLTLSHIWRHLKDQDFCGMYCAVDGQLGGVICCNFPDFLERKLQSYPSRDKERVSGKDVLLNSTFSSLIVRKFQ